MKQNKHQQKLNKIYQKYEHYYQDIMNEGFSQNDYDKIFNDFSHLLSQTRQEAVEEVFRIISEELSVAYPDPHKGWNDRIEMNVEDLCDAIEKALSQEKK